MTKQITTFAEAVQTSNNKRKATTTTATIPAASTKTSTPLMQVTLDENPKNKQAIRVYTRRASADKRTGAHGQQSPACFI